MQENNINQERLREIENFYKFNLKKKVNNIGKKTGDIVTSPKTGKVIGGVYKEAKSVSGNLNPVGKFLNKASDEFFKSGNFGWYLLGGIVALLVVAFIVLKIMK
jgi:hypothetical protein